MFEDSTFESTGRIKTRSRRWMFAALALNGSILIALVLVPLIYPNALPSHMMPSLLVAPAAPQSQTPPPPAHARATPHDFSEFNEGRITAPPRIPTTIRIPTGPEQPFAGPNIALDSGTGIPGGDGSPFGNGRACNHRPFARPLKQSVCLQSLSEGFLIYKSIPQYPIIAKSVGVQGTVVLQAIISKAGTIENLQIISGPQMLQQAAIDAVKNWRYRPYLLNNQPVEVETTVSVIFKLER